MYSANTQQMKFFKKQNPPQSADQNSDATEKPLLGKLKNHLEGMTNPDGEPYDYSLTEEEEALLSEELPDAEELPPVKRRLPKFCFILFGISLISGIIETICIFSPAFADFFNIEIARYSRIALAWLTAWIPFSLGELILLLLPLIVVILLIWANKYYADTWRNVGVFLLMMLSVLSVFFTLYVFTLGTGYRGTTLDQKLEIERKDVSADGLEYTAAVMVEKVNELSAEMNYGGDGFSVMPYGYDEMVSKLLDAFDTVGEEYDFIKSFRCPVKRVMHSEPWTYTHITGVYSYFTGESNININMPDYTVPFTAAHELAHQRGITREDEANFVAFLVCIASDDTYIQYCGYLNMFEYLSSPLYSADPDAYAAAYGKLPLEVKVEELAYSEFFEKYQQTVVSEVSEKINDTYLKLNGTAGTKSYGMVVDLCVAYYQAK